MSNKDFDSSQRETIWEKHMGNKIDGNDIFGRYMTRVNFECDHIYPKSMGGSTTIENGIPLAPKSNEEKSDNLIGTVNKKTFRVIDEGMIEVEGEVYP